MSRDIRTLGSVARALVGLLLLVAAYLADPSWWDVGAAVVLYPLLAVVTAAVAARLVPDLGRGIGGPVRGTGEGYSAAAAWASVGIGAVVVLLGTALTFVSAVDGGSLYLFFGGSMLLAAVKGYGGCEVLALPNLLLGRRDEIWCWLYSPLDRVERAGAGGDPAGG